jgi:NhaP-type Na+/H+ or K+/H+ antiporter
VPPNYPLIVLIMGIAFVGAAILPRLLRPWPISLPIIYVGVGMLLPLLWSESPRADPLVHNHLTERLAELAVLVSLMGAGLKLERKIGLKRWLVTWRLLFITMPLCILALALGGYYLMGLTLGGAVILGAVLAPTDPVLAASVQVGPPGEANESATRFALTSEAGLNDGLAFPFVNLGILLAGATLATANWTHWLAIDVAWKIAAGVGAGVVVGRVLAWLIFKFTRPNEIVDGFVAIAITLVAYGTAEIIHGYGFLAVFAAALVFRDQERDHELHVTLHSFVDQIERLLMAALLMFFGASITHGLFDALTWQSVAVAVAFILLVRPAAGMLGLIGCRYGRYQRLAIAGLGIRGIGTFYYLSHALNQTELLDENARALWATAGLIVLISIFLHGSTADRAMHLVQREENQHNHPHAAAEN